MHEHSGGHAAGELLTKQRAEVPGVQCLPEAPVTGCQAQGVPFRQSEREVSVWTRDPLSAWSAAHHGH